MRLFLEENYLQYNNPSFISSDPVSVPHRFVNRNDREISGFLTANIAWGRRDLILRSCSTMLNLMDNSPYDFTMSASEKELAGLTKFVHVLY
jgi:hypothetical protein